MRLHPIVAAAAASLALGAFAQEASYDFVACTHSKLTVLEASPELTTYTSETWGSVATSTTKEWEGATTHCVGYARAAAGKPPAGKGACKWVLASGDGGVGEYEYGQGEPKWTWLAGAGKFKGIEGGGTFRWLGATRAVEAGTSQGCRRDWGKYRLPVG